MHGHSCHPPVDHHAIALAAIVVVPYVQSVSEAVSRILRPLNIRTCFRPDRSLHDILTQAEDAIDAEKKAGMVYRIPCKDCPVMYVGQTGQSLSKRAQEHHRICWNGNIELLQSLNMPGRWCMLLDGLMQRCWTAATGCINTACWRRGIFVTSPTPLTETVVDCPRPTIFFWLGATNPLPRCAAMQAVMCHPQLCFSHPLDNLHAFSHLHF